MRLDAARQLVADLEGLSSDERNTLAQSLEDLVRDTPKTPLAVMRFEKLISRAGAAAAHAMKQILFDVVAEAARKALWPEPVETPPPPRSRRRR